jgi:thiol-disulfide isomerase/thioredoxin
MQYFGKFRPIHAILSILLIQYSLFGHALAECPNLILMDLKQEERNLCEYIGNGKWVIVNIWGPSCPACIEELPELELFHDSHYESDAIVLGIAIDFPTYGYADLEEVTKFVESYDIEYPILLADSDITVQLGANHLKGIPTTLVFDPSGKLINELVGIITVTLSEELIAQYEIAN